MNFVEKAIFEKARKTAKNAENQRKSLGFKCDPFRTRVMEAPPGIGPGIKVLQTSALPLGYGAVLQKSHDISWLSSGADYGARTRHLDLGKVALYQMS